jgi:hypothetical protein
MLFPRNEVGPNGQQEFCRNQRIVEGRGHERCQFEESWSSPIAGALSDCNAQSGSGRGKETTFFHSTPALHYLPSTRNAKTL